MSIAKLKEAYDEEMGGSDCMSRPWEAEDFLGDWVEPAVEYVVAVLNLVPTLLEWALEVRDSHRNLSLVEQALLDAVLGSDDQKEDVT